MYHLIVIYSIINKLASDNIDINIRNQKDDLGIEHKYLDFVSVTEKSAGIR